MKILKRLPINKWIGYGLLMIYVIVAIIFIVFCTTLDMLPIRYMIIIGVIFAIFSVVFLIMHENLIPSIIASVLSVVLITGCILGSVYIRKTGSTMTQVTTAKLQTDVISVYVMNDSPAKSTKDIVDDQIGIVANVDRENTDKTIKGLEADTGAVLKIKAYDNMLTMMDKLKAGTIGAVIMNEAYIGSIADVENYQWVLTDIHVITTLEHHSEAATDTVVPENVPETFIMYLSGIDAYGGVSVRSRSDVNIMAVVNTKTKSILLLSTPRDSYVSYSVTGGAKDKLTHAGIYGVEASMDALQQLYGVEINYYLRMNFSGFIDVIDALGGIEVYSDYDFSVENIRSYQKGYNQVTGLEALAFARERYSFLEGDYQRAKNQMEVIRAVVQKLASSSLLVNYNSVMNAIAGSFETSMPDDQIASLVKMQLSDMAQWNITSYTISGTSMYAQTYSMPGQELYVIEPDPASVQEAKRLIQEIYDGGTNND